MVMLASYRKSDRRVDAILAELERLDWSGDGGLSVLDFGAHNGHIAFRLADEGYLVTAVDETFGLAKKGVNGIWGRVDVAGIPALGRFDVVLGLSVLHHFTDWTRAFLALRECARRALIVEVPHPDEVLRSAASRHQLAALNDFVGSFHHRTIAVTPATRQPELRRETRVIAPSIFGRVFGGSGNHAKSQRKYGHLFEQALGYRPFPGSLNVRLDRNADLGPEQIRLRPDAIRDYRLWNARLPEWPGVPLHVMDVGTRGHGPDCVELLSPVRLRDFVGETVAVEVLW